MHDSDLVLVAVVPSARDYEIARMLGWYRIPLRSAPKMLFVDCLALYQPKSTIENEFGVIAQYARVHGHELVRRFDLFRDEPDHPRAKEEYFKIALGPLQSLASPILAKGWTRLTFLYTTGKHVMEAEVLSDLVVRDRERAQLWHSIREHAEKGSQYMETPSFSLDISPEMLSFIVGQARA
ncbi:MAG: hypothetical protein V2J07_03205 [Anaerolineae bacterium]|nr:hypothetical protein [Anaerolineae bacterium]